MITIFNKIKNIFKINKITYIVKIIKYSNDKKYKYIYLYEYENKKDAIEHIEKHCSRFYYEQGYICKYKYFKRYK